MSIETKLAKLEYREKKDTTWTTDAIKIYFKDIDYGYYIGLVVDVKEQKIVMDFVRNDHPPHVYQNSEFEIFFRVYEEYKKDINILKTN